MLKTKKSKFNVFTILTIAVLLCLITLLANFDDVFGLKRKEIQTVDGDVDVSVTLNVMLDSSSLSSIRSIYYVEFDLTSNSSVTTVEIERINYRIYHNTEIVFTYNGPGGRIWIGINLQFGDNLTCQGYIDLNYQLSSIPHNATVNDNVVYTHNIRQQEALNYNVSKFFISSAYFASFFLLPIILYFIIHPDFREPSKEDKEKSDEYFDYLAKLRQKNEKDPNTNS